MAATLILLTEESMPEIFDRRANTSAYAIKMTPVFNTLLKCIHGHRSQKEQASFISLTT